MYVHTHYLRIHIGLPYYYNAVTGESVWTEPPDYVTHETAYYYASADRRASLAMAHPPGIKEKQGKEGRRSVRAVSREVKPDPDKLKEEDGGCMCV